MGSIVLYVVAQQTFKLQLFGLAKLLWHYSGTTLALLWHYSGTALALLWHYSESTLSQL